MPFPFKSHRKHDDDNARPFPTVEDIAQYMPNPKNPEWPAYAHWDLHHLVELDLADVYLPAGWVAAGHRRFNVWRGQHLCPPSGERITLEEWCVRWLAQAEADWEVTA